MKGKEVECNRKIAYYSAKQESPEAQYQIGSMYEKGEGAEQNYEKANKWFVASVAQVYGKAIYPVARAYKDENDEKVFNWYREQSNLDAKKLTIFLCANRNFIIFANVPEIK